MDRGGSYPWRRNGNSPEAEPEIVKLLPNLPRNPNKPDPTFPDLGSHRNQSLYRPAIQSSDPLEIEINRLNPSNGFDLSFQCRDHLRIEVAIVAPQLDLDHPSATPISSGFS